MTIQLQRSSNAPLVMGILNLTPDSFSDGGTFIDPQRALDHALHMEAHGAAIIDIGAESTRPGASPINAAEEWRRIEPLLAKLVGNTKALISIDTYRPETARRALAEGAGMINDVYAGLWRESGAPTPGSPDSTLTVAAQANSLICLMHMRGHPATMQERPEYADVLAEVAQFLRGRVNAAVTAGIPPERICIDPGFGFGKTLDHNRALMANLSKLTQIAPVLVGFSRKRSLAQLSGSDDPRRLPESIAAALVAAQNGASIIRVHDVSETVRALRVWAGLR